MAILKAQVYPTREAREQYTDFVEREIFTSGNAEVVGTYATSPGKAWGVEISSFDFVGE